jgi:hypothetical protein
LTDHMNLKMFRVFNTFEHRDSTSS